MLFLQHKFISVSGKLVNSVNWLVWQYKSVSVGGKFGNSVNWLL